MVNYEYGYLFQKDYTDKKLIISSDDGLVNITNEELHQQQFELTESLCSESELRFGSCETSMIKFTISNTFIPLTGKWLTVKMIVEGHTDNPFQIGRYKVFSDTVTADRTKRDVIAYDVLYDIINSDVSAWYNSVLPNKSDWITMRSFRTSFMSHFGIEQETIELVNDYAKVERTIDPEQMSGLDVISAICEINGCFGHITREGKFRYIYLPQAIQGLYPANNLFPDHAPDYLPYQQRTGHLYPQDPKSTKLGADGTYISCKYEDYLCNTIDKLQIRQEENDIGVIVGRTGENCYIIEDNFLVYGKSSEELWQIANNVFNKITDIVYRPFGADVKGNPCFEVGDPVRITTKYEIVESYILQRTLKGIQALRDNYNADGVEMYSEKVNGVHRSIVQLKGKSNVLERNIEETRSELRDTANGLQTQITQNASNITLEATRAKGEEEKLSARINVNADQISLRVVKGTVSSEISQEAGKISISANRISISSDYFTLTDDGRITATAGTIGGINIGTNGISATNFSITSDGRATFTGINITSGSGSFSSGFGVSGTARDQFDNLVANNATINNLIAQRATIEQLNATSATLQNLIANKIDASTVKAEYMEVANWTTAGHIKAEKIDAETIKSKIASLSAVNMKGLLVEGSVTISGAFNFNGDTIMKKTINGTTYLVTVS